MSEYFEIKPDRANIITVQRGEALGHEHVFDDPSAVKLFGVKKEESTKTMIAVFLKETQLKHISRRLKETDDLHGAIPVPNSKKPIERQGDVMLSYLGKDELKMLNLPYDVSDTIGGVRIKTQQEWANGVSRRVID